MRLFPACLAVALLVTPFAVAGCKRSTPAIIIARGDTFAEMRTIKGDVSLAAPGEAKRTPYPRERLADGCEVTLGAGALAWIRRDAGAVWLVGGPAQLRFREDAVKLSSGRAFIDAEDGPPVRIDSPRGAIELSDARASVEMLGDGSEDIYVLRGAARLGASAERATAGEQMSIKPDGSAARAPAVAWDDWTGGLATADPVAQPAPFGLGTVGARPPGDKGKPRFSLVIERLDVRVTVDHDFAVTEVDQTFENPSSDTVEGIFSFRTPPGAVLHKFGVDRDGELVWGKVKESASAKAQYETNVYQGSTEDPALLSWVAPGVYNARLYPIQAGTKRRVVTRYAEWLSRQGPNADRRLYVYPMAAEGARGSLPRIEELRVSLDLAKAGTTRVRAGMNGKVEGKNVVIQAFDFVPRADLAVELFDDGEPNPVAYRASHALTADDIPMNADAKFAAKVSSEEPDYLLVPLRSTVGEAGAPAKGIDLAIVVDTSAATESGALAIARSLTSALLAHLGPDDRVALWAGDATLRPVKDGSGELVAASPNRRREWLSGLANVERGGATDLGALLTEAASRLDAKRQGAVLYIGDGHPSVGEISLKSLRERMLRLPPATRIFAAGVGSRANMTLLDSISRGAPAELVGDAYGAARAALRLLEAAQRPAWVSASVVLGEGVERVLPRELPPVSADDSVLVVGRLAGKAPSTVELKSGQTAIRRPLRVVPIEDSGDLRRRWGQGRMQELLAAGAGRAALVDIGRRYALVSPYTSLYVPTAREVAQSNALSEEALAEARADAIERRRWWRPWSRSSRNDESAMPFAAAPPSSDNKEGGTGTRAKGEEGSMGNPAGAPEGQRRKALEDAPTAKSSPAAPSDTKDSSARGNMWGDAAGNAFGAGGMGLAGIGEGGGGRESIGLGSVGTLGHGAATGTGQGFGSGHGRLGGGHDSAPARPLANAVHVDVTGPIGVIGHAPRPCGVAAELPLAERRILWSERLSTPSAQGSADGALAVYRRALEDCEAPTWRERTTLLLLIVEQLRSVTARVALWKSLILTPAADVVYRAIVVRVQNVNELHELHKGLGLASVDPDLLAGMVAKAKTPAERLGVLRAAAMKWSDDLELGLRVLDAHEDAADDGGGRAWASRLRRRADATAHVWTSVGEYYLRLAAREQGADAERDRIEARRTFGELVEFAPDDPAARRRLGDLLRAHGWYEESLRQYLTLQTLTPDDEAVPLLIAAAAQGLGRVEEAVGWAEKASAAGSPDGKSALSRAARATATVLLAWAREEALRTGKKEDADKLFARARRLVAASAQLAARDAQAEEQSVRILVTWSHPELHPSLWTTTLGAPMPSPDNFPSFGVAEAKLSVAPSTVELRLEPDDAARAARLGLKATVTVIAGLGTPAEKIVTQEVGFGTVAAPATRLVVTFAGDALRVGSP
jgi:Ca-activated chloride channel family protein